MGVGARERFSLTQFVLKLLACVCAATSAQTAFATSAQITNTDIAARVPGPNQPITINLRQLGVITGTAPLSLSPNIQVFWNGEPTQRVLASVSGAVCVSLRGGITPEPGDRFALQISVSNRQGRAERIVDLTNTPGPTVPADDPSCADPNSPPTANAGTYPARGDSDGLAGESLQMNGSGTDREGDTLTFAWLVNQVLVQGATAPNSTLRLPDGTSRVTLQVTDEGGLVANDTVSIIVAPPSRQPPSANAGVDQSVPDRDGVAGEAITLSGSGSDADGTIASYQWFLGQSLLGSGPTLNTRIPNGANTVTLIVTDSTELTASDTVTITVGAPQPPTANAGPDQTIPDRDGIAGEAVTLSGSANDPDGTIASYEWRLGQTVLGAGQTLSTRIANGVNAVTLVVTDNAGLTASDTVQISVAASQAPTVNAGVDRTVADSDGAPGELVTLTGSATDDGTIASYRWTLGATPLGTGATVQARLPNGVNTVTLTATDNAGLTGTDTVQITVAAPPQPPTANAGPDQTVADRDGVAGELVTLSGTGTDPDGNIAAYEWLLGQTLLGTSATLEARIPNGVNVVTLRVTDNSRLTATDTVQITVGAQPQPPTANAGADQTVADTDSQPGEQVTLTGSGTDPDGSVQSYTWLNGTQPLGTGATLGVRLGDGAHTITLRVTDNAGLTANDTVQITVSEPDTPDPQPPTANAGADQTIADSDGIAGEVVTFAGSATDPDGTIASYRWSIGPTQLGTGATLQTRIANGASDVTLTVTDSSGLTDTDIVRVTIGAPRAPTANAGADQALGDSDGEPGELVTFSGSGADNDGTVASYEWRLGETQLGTGATLQSRLPNGVSVVTLIVTDNAGLTGSDTVQITIGAARTPTVNAGADQTLADSDGVAAELVTLSGTATDADGSIATYQWLLGDSPLGAGATLQVRIPDGSNAVTLRVTDNTGLTATDTVQITVTAPARPPTANAGADQNVADVDGQPGELVTLNGSGSDPDGAIASYQWLLGNTNLGSGATLQARLPDGDSVLSLVVTDDSGLTATDTVQITVAAPVLPIVDAGISQTIEDTDVQPGELVQLTGTATTSGGAITQYQWYLGDNLIGTGSSLSVRLPDGVNVVTLRATNSANLVGSASVQITVSAGVRTVLAAIPGLTPNEQRLAQKLDEACNNVLGPLTATSDSTPAPIAQDARAPSEADAADFRQKCRGLLRSRDTAALADAMGALLGDDFAAARTQTLLFANTQYASVMDRLIALRGGAKGLSLAGLNIMVDGEMIPLADLQDLAKELLGGGASSDADGGLWSDKWGLWARGNFSFGSKEENAFSPSFDADQYALLAGLDYRLAESAVIGAALAYGNSSVEFNPTNEGSLDTESWALSVYGSLYAKRNFYFDAIVNVADAGYEAERNITYVDGYGLVSTDASGETGGMTLSGGLAGGYDFLIGGLTISPTLGVFYIDAQIDEFTEAGAGGLNLIYDEQQFKSLTGNLGVRMTFSWNLPWGVLLPHFRADFVREFEDDVDVFGIRFAGDPNAASTPPILVETENPDSSYWRLAAGFSAQFRYGISGYVEYQRLESFEFISFQDVSVGLRFQAAF